MALRIVEEIHEDGLKHYIVETNRKFFGLFKADWHVATAYIDGAYSGDVIPVPAIFNTLKEAQLFCGIDPNPIIKQNIIQTIGI